MIDFWKKKYFFLRSLRVKFLQISHDIFSSTLLWSCRFENCKASFDFLNKSNEFDANPRIAVYKLCFLRKIKMKIFYKRDNCSKNSNKKVFFAKPTQYAYQEKKARASDFNEKILYLYVTRRKGEFFSS